MSPLRRTMIAASGVALWLLALGFVMFSTAVMRTQKPSLAKADGIVVLTGGENRVAEGAKLLLEGRAQRMLISGVNTMARRNEVRVLSGLPKATFDCCVDLGYVALNTIGNAEETRVWAEAKGYDSLIVVTASYHMPRSFAELSRVMPNIELIAHPVVPKAFRQQPWWLHTRTTRTLVAEYLKFLPSAARYGVARLLWPFDTSSIAAVNPAGRGT